jgi:hypothetical protein
MSFCSDVYVILRSFFFYLSFRTKPEYKNLDEDLEINYLNQTMER